MCISQENIFLWFLLDNSDVKCAYFCVTMYKIHIYSPVWRQLWAYNTVEIINLGVRPQPIILWVLYVHNYLQPELYPIHIPQCMGDHHGNL